MSWREFTGKIGQTKFRYFVILLLGYFLNNIFNTLMGNIMPNENRDALMIIIGVVASSFTMGMQHTMKTPEKEKNEVK